MTELANTVAGKTVELEKALKSAGLWQKEIPAWVHWYDDSNRISPTDFAQWLQFVFIPNHLQKSNIISVAEKNMIVPHAIKFFGDDVKKGKLLQILIEIDSLL
jgi:uncharacterized protein YqcC (DUF446 family)